MNPSARISRPMLSQLEEKISNRDMNILQVVQEHRFLTTRQVTGFCFTDKPTPTAALRAAHRALKKLADLTLITPLERRIGGVRAGSGGAIWSLTEPGQRLLTHLKGGDLESRRQRFREPSTAFLVHTLAVADVHLALQQTTAADERVRLQEVELEPACWRAYLGLGGTPLTLKPDLAAITRTVDFEDHWFLEVDRATEPPSRIVRKCQQYQDYYRTGNEQQRHGVFPLVVWIVPTARRQTQLEQRLHDELAIDSRLFVVITLEDLPTLLRTGPPTAQPTT